MDMWQRAGELDDDTPGIGIPLGLLVSFIAVCSATLLVVTVAPAVSQTLADYCPLGSAPSVLAAAALFFAVAVAPAVSAASLREAVARGGSANAHQAFSALVMTAILVPFLVLATRAVSVPAGPVAKAVLLFGVTSAAGLLFSAVLGRWYLPAAAAVLGGAPLVGFILVEIEGAKAGALFRLSAFAELGSLLSPAGSAAARDSFLGGCLVLYGALLVAGLLFPKPAAPADDER